MDISFDCKSAEIRSNGPNFVTVDCSKVEVSEVLNHFTIKEIIDHFDLQNVLDTIGQSECEQYFDLIPNENS